MSLHNFLTSPLTRSLCLSMLISPLFYSLPAQAKVLTIRSEARVIAPTPEERKLSEFLAEIIAQRKARENAIAVLKEYEAFQHSGLNDQFIEAMANAYIQRYLSYYDESSAWEREREVRYKVKYEYETLNFPEDFEVLFSRDYGNILVSKYAIQESNTLEKRIQDYFVKLRSSTDPGFRKLLRDSEGKKLLERYKAGELMDEARDLLKRKDLEKAKEKLNHAQKLAPDSLIAVLLNAFTHMGLEEYGKSQQILTEQIKRTPDSDLYLLRGIFYLIENINLKQAQQDLALVVEQDPDNGLAHLMNGAILASLDRKVEAERSLQKACDVGIKKACDAKFSDIRFPQQEQRPRPRQP